MNIGFDAKRYFFNRSGLGNYSRFVVDNLIESFPENQYLLFSPKPGGIVAEPESPSASVVLPSSGMPGIGRLLWRRYGIGGTSEAELLDIYHGLSHELPHHFNPTTKLVVTMHDCIFLRYPELFDASYRYIFSRKYAHALKTAHGIIAISEQSKADVCHYFNIAPERIEVVYQGCNDIFYQPVSDERKAEVKTLYNLPNDFILYVGTIEPRKNLLGIFEAMVTGHIDMPLVAIGKATKYAEKVNSFVQSNNLQSQALLLHGVPNEHLPALYQMAKVFVYPSMFEGFGIPILEAMVSGTPVITTAGSCFPEVGGPDTRYVDFGNNAQLAAEMNTVLNDSQLQETMASNGLTFASRFHKTKVTADMMAYYQKILNA